MSPSSSKRKALRDFFKAAVGVLVLLGAFWLYTKYAMKPNPVKDVFQILSEQGYSANIGFADDFEPGNVIQIAEGGVDGHDRVFATPLTFMWASDCFPAIKTRDSTFVVPESQGTSSASLTIDAAAMSRFVPSLNVGSTAVADFAIRFANPRVRTIPRGELSGSLSTKCVRALDREISTGDKVEWFQVIVESVVADGFSFEMTWKAGTSADVRRSVVEDTSGKLSRLADKGTSNAIIPAGVVRVAQDDHQKTVLATDRPVVIAYRSRPIMPTPETDSR